MNVPCTRACACVVVTVKCRAESSTIRAWWRNFGRRAPHLFAQGDDANQPSWRSLTLDPVKLNQSMRWVMTKEEHCSKIITMIGEYCLCQRIKAAEMSPEDYVDSLEDSPLGHAKRDEVQAKRRYRLLLPLGSLIGRPLQDVHEILNDSVDALTSRRRASRASGEPPPRRRRERRAHRVIFCRVPL